MGDEFLVVKRGERRPTDDIINAARAHLAAKGFAHTVRDDLESWEIPGMRAGGWEAAAVYLRPESMHFVVYAWDPVATKALRDMLDAVASIEPIELGPDAALDERLDPRDVFPSESTIAG